MSTLPSDYEGNSLPPDEGGEDPLHQEDENEVWDLDILRSRHDARARAVQVLYAIEIGEQGLGEALDDLVRGGEQKYIEFARKLVQLAHSRRDELDRTIEEKARHWKLNRIAVLDRLILRMAMSELLYVKDVPPKVTINEAIEIGKHFSTDQS
ncbi:transcription antitermination factor NusB, partial [bacterium]|nr:transcription antitermination factor NusB [bacterium]